MNNDAWWNDCNNLNKKAKCERDRLAAELAHCKADSAAAWDKCEERRMENADFRRALDDLGVTPEEAKAGAIRSRARQEELGRLAAENERLKAELAKAQQYIYYLTNSETGEVPALEAELAALKKGERNDRLD